jgi:hypothetical protein
MYLLKKAVAGCKFSNIFFQESFSQHEAQHCSNILGNQYHQESRKHAIYRATEQFDEE